MQPIIKVDKHFIEPEYNIVKAIKSYGDELGKVTNVRADHTDWHLHHKDRTFDPFINKFHEIYPKHIIKELWGCNYRRGDYAEAHNHHGFELAFVWFVDTCDRCSPLVFPDTPHLWMPPVHSFTPKRGTLLVFGGLDTHYVPPHTCDHERTVMSGNVQLRSLNTEVDTEDPWH